MKIAIIGGSGFVGTRLIELLKDVYDVTNIDKQKSHFHNDITKIADVRNESQLLPLLQGIDLVVLLAAEHSDNVTPTSLYYDVNVDGMRNVLNAMEANHIKRLFFTSSVSVYGLNKDNPNETHPIDPFNHYGKSKYQAEIVLQDWAKTHDEWNINIVRPTVIFGERNRGNVYNLLHQIVDGRFVMIGTGNNAKSMAYIGNIVTFIKYCIENKKTGYNIYNYADKPDLTMNELVSLVSKIIGKHISHKHIPYWLGMIGGYWLDLLAFILHRKFTISSVRVKKFCVVSKYDSSKVCNTDFKAPYTLDEGFERTLRFEFIDKTHETDGVLFKSE